MILVGEGEEERERGRLLLPRSSFPLGRRGAGQPRAVVEGGKARRRQWSRDEGRGWKANMCGLSIVVERRKEGEGNSNSSCFLQLLFPLLFIEKREKKKEV